MNEICPKLDKIRNNVICSKWVNRSTSKFIFQDRSLVKTIVDTLSIKRVPDIEIIQEIERQTGNSITRLGL